MLSNFPTQFDPNNLVPSEDEDEIRDKFIYKSIFYKKKKKKSCNKVAKHLSTVIFSNTKFQ